MKKAVSVLFTLCLILALSIPTFALNAVVDESYTLSDAEVLALESRLDEIKDKYNVDVAYITTDALYSPQGVMESADDLFDYQGYGLGENRDGILFYICMNTREYHFSTSGSAMEAFNQNGIRYLKSEIEPLLSAGDYVGATNKYADICDELLEMAAAGKPYNKKDMKTVLIAYGGGIAAAVVLAFVLTKKKESEMHTAVKNEKASNYMKPGSMNITYSQDIFLYSNVIRKPKPKQNSSSGSHTSSSGRSHGGGGGSF